MSVSTPLVPLGLERCMRAARRISARCERTAAGDVTVAVRGVQAALARLQIPKTASQFAATGLSVKEVCVCVRVRACVCVNVCVCVCV